MLNRPSLTTIRNRIKADMEARLTGGIALLPVGLLNVVVTVFAGSIHIMYGLLQRFSLNIMVDKAENDWLERHGIMWGVERNEASYAKGVLTITGTAATVVPVGTLFQQSGTSLEYATDQEYIIGGGGSVQANITAVEPGLAHNFLKPDPFAILFLTLVSPIVNVNDVAAVTGAAGEISGGADQETDEAYRERILERIRLPVSGGNESDYLRWAKSVNGVTDAWVYPTFAGAGTVAVAIKPADSGLASIVQDYIDTVKPVTANQIVSQYVFPITESLIVYDISISPNNTDTQDAIRNAIIDLHNEDGVPGTPLLISHIRSAIASTGVFDYEITAIEKDGSPVPVDNIDFVDFEFPVLDTINWSTL